MQRKGRGDGGGEERREVGDFWTLDRVGLYICGELWSKFDRRGGRSRESGESGEGRLRT